MKFIWFLNNFLIINENNGINVCFLSWYEENFD